MAFFGIGKSFETTNPTSPVSSPPEVKLKKDTYLIAKADGSWVEARGVGANVSKETLEEGERESLMKNYNENPFLAPSSFFPGR